MPHDEPALDLQAVLKLNPSRSRRLIAELDIAKVGQMSSIYHHLVMNNRVRAFTVCLLRLCPDPHLRTIPAASPARRQIITSAD
jgi:hypothetical protein